MPFFRPIKIRGVTYSLDHLDPFTFDVETGCLTRRVHVIFRCHCFTVEIAPHHKPDFHYVHGGERRAFDLNRHQLSLLLPDMLKTLGSRSVYRALGVNYFILRQDAHITLKGPYLVFFRVAAARRRGTDVLMNVESAYIIPNMALRASPVRFTTLVEKTARGEFVPVGPEQTIKRQ